MAQFPLVRKERKPQQRALITHWAWRFFTYGRSAEGLPDIKEQVALMTEGADEENRMDEARVTSAFKQYLTCSCNSMPQTALRDMALVRR